MSFSKKIFGWKQPSLYSFKSGSEKSLISSEKSLPMSPKKKKDDGGNTPGFTLRNVSVSKPWNSLFKYVNNTLKPIDEKVDEEKRGDKELLVE